MKPTKSEKSEAYTLDTSAILALWNDEEGADIVEGILRRAKNFEVRVYFSFMTAMELYYNFKRRHGKQTADELYAVLGFLPAERVNFDERILLEAANIKADNQLSVADAWIAATASVTSSTLVHKDPEFEALEGMVKLRGLT
jgi:predicted nucleic acid-binding protein